MQTIVRQLPRPDVLPDVLFGPVEQRAYLVQAVLVVPFDGVGQGTRRRLLAADPGDPRRVPGYSTLKRLDLTDPAAGQARIQSVVETIEALIGHKRLQRLRIRMDDSDLSLVAALQLLQDLV